MGRRARDAQELLNKTRVCVRSHWRHGKQGRRRDGGGGGGARHARTDEKHVGSSSPGKSRHSCVPLARSVICVGAAATQKPLAMAVRGRHAAARAAQCPRGRWPHDTLPPRSRARTARVASIPARTAAAHREILSCSPRVTNLGAVHLRRQWQRRWPHLQCTSNDAVFRMRARRPSPWQLCAVDILDFLGGGRRTSARMCGFYTYMLVIA